MSRVISDEEIAKAVQITMPLTAIEEIVARPAAKAQRDSSDKEWIETLRRFETLDANNKPYIHISPISWQVLQRGK